MRIIHFCKNIVVDELETISIKDCPLVIDGQNYLQKFYEKSGLPYAFGCESNKFAKYLRRCLSIFKKANIQCYFIFKGGHINLETKLKNFTQDNWSSFPCLMKDVYKQILNEMGFNYVVCEHEAKRECIALAQKLNCPIMSYDIEYCFSGVTYIPSEDNIMLYDENSKAIRCSVFKLESFLRKYNITKEHLPTFIILTDVHIFPDNTFSHLFKALKIPTGYYQRNKRLLNWLSKTSDKEASDMVYKFLSPDDKNRFVIEKSKLLEFICRKETPGLPTEYLMNGNHIDFDEKDTKWFQKGIASGNIPIQYINLTLWNKIFGSWCIEDADAEDSMLLSIDIIKYAYNLLTNYKGKEIIFSTKKNEDIYITDLSSIPKPNYEATESPFENGWRDIKSIKLFDYFLQNTLKGYHFNRLDVIPEDAKMLFIALVYFSHHKGADMTCEVFSIILSYLLLGVVIQKPLNNNLIRHSQSIKPILDSNLDENSVTEIDCEIAKSAMQKYFDITEYETHEIFYSKLLHPLVEFQHCLNHLNFLNILCGSYYKPTIYSKTYNSTFVYKVVYEMKTKYNGNAKKFMTTELSSAATVLALFNGLSKVFEEVLHR